MNPPRTGSHAAKQNEPVSIITPRIIAPPPSSSSPKTLQFGPGLLFLAMFTLGRNFRRFNGTWAIVHSLLYGTLPSFPQKGEERPICLKWTQNKRVYVRVQGFGQTTSWLPLRSTPLSFGSFNRQQHSFKILNKSDKFVLLEEHNHPHTVHG